MRERCPLAVWAVTPAVSASSDAVWAWLSISSDSMERARRVAHQGGDFGRER